MLRTNLKIKLQKCKKKMQTKHDFLNRLLSKDHFRIKIKDLLLRFK